MAALYLFCLIVGGGLLIVSVLGGVGDADADGGLELEAASKEKVAVAEADRARAVAEQRLEEARVELQQRRLQADVVEPAEAEKRAAELRAEGNAAQIREKGLAQVAVFQALLQQMAGGRGLDLESMLRGPSVLARGPGAANHDGNGSETAKEGRVGSVVRHVES